MEVPRLRQWREMRALTQEELAEAAGVSPRSVAGYEAGSGARPGTVRKLAAALGIEVTDLFQEELTVPKGEALFSDKAEAWLREREDRPAYAPFEEWASVVAERAGEKLDPLAALQEEKQRLDADFGEAFGEIDDLIEEIKATEVRDRRDIQKLDALARLRTSMRTNLIQRHGEKRRALISYQTRFDDAQGDGFITPEDVRREMREAIQKTQLEANA